MPSKSQRVRRKARLVERGRGWNYPAMPGFCSGLVLSRGFRLSRHQSLNPCISTMDTGTKITARSVEAIMLPKSAVPNACQLAAPAPRAIGKATA
jgi:hypothetical protein